MILCTLIILAKNLLVVPVATCVAERLDVDGRLGFGRRKKFNVSFWKAIFYSLTSLYGYIILKDELWMYTVEGLNGTWGVQNTPWKILFYYHLEFSYYLIELFYLFNEPVYKDFLQMLVHHIVTLKLILVSYHKDQLRYGVVIMAIHDISDPFLEICKVLNYVYDGTWITTLLFTFFAMIFIITRLGIYTGFVVVPGSMLCWYRGFDPFMYDIGFMLQGLVVLHVIWTFMVVRLAIRIITGSKPEDSRSILTSTKIK